MTTYQWVVIISISILVWVVMSAITTGLSCKAWDTPNARKPGTGDDFAFMFIFWPLVASRLVVWGIFKAWQAIVESL